MAKNVILFAIWRRDDFSLTPQDLWTPQDPHLPHHSLSSSPIHQSPQHLFPKNPSPIKSHLSLHHSHPSFIKPHLPHHSNSNHFPTQTHPQMAEPYLSPLLYKPSFTPSFSHNLTTSSSLFGRTHSHSLLSHFFFFYSLLSSFARGRANILSLVW